MDGEGRILATDTDRSRAFAPRAARRTRRRRRSSRRACSIPGAKPRRSTIWSARADRRADRRALLRHRHVAAQPGGALAADPGADRATGRDCRRACSTSRATLVKPGGALVYIVCSLLDEEGRGAGRRVSSRAIPIGWPTRSPCRRARRRRRASPDAGARRHRRLFCRARSSRRASRVRTRAHSEMIMRFPPVAVAACADAARGFERQLRPEAGRPDQIRAR